MPLSRLENFLKNVTGNVIYVNPEELDATDDISNTGNSRTRPFKTIQRALIEAARFSYQIGADNDRFDKTTILVSPGTHYIDNRPGLRINTSGSLTDINGTAATIDQFGVGTNFDINDPNNVLYKFNSAHGGVVLPRGTSIVGQDLRKTKIKPKFVPKPDDDAIESTAIFRVTGACWFFGFSFFDGDPNDRVFRDYTTNVYAPNYSHHKLTCFEYADGVNNITGQGNTDLDMYYQKLTLAYGTNSGRALPNYPANTDFEAIIDESRIVGAISQVGSLVISDIYSGANPTDTVATPVVTVVTQTGHGFNVGTPILITGVEDSDYDGSYIVSQILSDTSFTYSVPATPSSTATPNLSGKSPAVKIESDTVQSASPYIFNCSIRSVFGLNGMFADGAKATGFKSMVVAQFTGIALNKDDNAYVKYNTTTGAWEDQAALGTSVSLHTDSLARHKPGWENYHVRVANNGIIQAVSVFAIGYAKHFLAESGGDMSITNSNSNFGAKALQADKCRFEAFLKDDKGYITEINVPQRNFANTTNVNYLALDVEKTVAAANTRLYLYEYDQKDNIPPKGNNGFTFGNKVGETIEVGVGDTNFAATVLMPVPQASASERVSARKEHFVGRTSGINSITSNTFTLRDEHKFLSGEKIKIYSENGALPDGLKYNQEYFAVTTGLNNNQIQVATTFNNAVSGDELTGINNLGGELRVVSIVEGKEPGEPGHPVQYDGGWYVNVGAGNSLHAAIVSQQTDITPKTKTAFYKRKYDLREDNERRYGVKLVIPSSETFASAPTAGFSLADASTVPDDTNYQNDNNTLTSESNLRTKTNIINASWSGNVGVITAEYPHGLKTGQVVQIYRLKSGNNEGGSDNSGFNGIFEVSAISNSLTFSVGLNTNPGGITTITTGTPYTFHDRTVAGAGRTFSPYFVKRDYAPSSYQIHQTDEIQEFKAGTQDGIYDLTLRGYISQPTTSPFSTDAYYFGQDITDITPYANVDNDIDDPIAAVSYAVRDEIGNVETNDPHRSITREGLNSFLEDVGAVIPITSSSHSSGSLTFVCDREHGFDGVSGIQSVTGGTNLGTGSGNAEFYYNVRLEGGTGQNATADVTVAAAGTITSVVLNHPGSGYSVDDTLTIQGVPRSASGDDCTVGVANIAHPVGDAVQVVGVGSTAYNGTRRIESITNSTTFTVSGSADGSSTGGYLYHVGVTTAVTDIRYDKTSGIGTVQLEGDIGLRRGDRIVIDGSAAFYNGTHFITDRIGYGSSLSVNFGKNSTVPSFTASSVTAHGEGINIRGNGRSVPIYGGHTCRLSSGITTTSTSFVIPATDKNNLRRGDFLQIEDEIVMVSNSNITSLIRGVMGTNATDHDAEVAVRKIKVLPVESRRYSVLRASGHTFEYVGFGPGNYSTAMPQTQDRRRSEREELIAQSIQHRGGFVVYSGMNDSGDFYIGGLKIAAGSGELTVIGGLGGRDVETRVGAGAYPTSAVFNDITVAQSIQSNGDTEVIDLLLRGNRSGDVGKSVYLGIHDGNSTPTSNVDNILLRTSYTSGGYLGWVRTTGSWKRFGPISKSSTSEHYEVDRLEVTGISTFSDEITLNGDLEQTGSQNVSATVTATTFVGNGTIPVGGIIMWSGTVAAIPAGWALCDGSNSTPDLRNRFVIGAGSSYNPDATGGSADAVVVAHTHTATSNSTSSVTDPGHAHTFSSNDSDSGTGNTLNDNSNQANTNTMTSSTETTGITVSTTTTTTIDSEGVSGTGKNLPPYLALAYIMRTV